MYKYLVLVFYYAFLTAWLLMEILDYFKWSRIQMLHLRIYWTSMARELWSSCIMQLLELVPSDKETKLSNPTHPRFLWCLYDRNVHRYSVKFSFHRIYASLSQWSFAFLPFVHKESCSKPSNSVQLEENQIKLTKSELSKDFLQPLHTVTTNKAW